jgi:hypothetical protein
MAQAFDEFANENAMGGIGLKYGNTHEIGPGESEGCGDVRFPGAPKNFHETVHRGRILNKGCTASH